jgi:hypothetical protein
MQTLPASSLVVTDKDGDPLDGDGKLRTTTTPTLAGRAKDSEEKPLKGEAFKLYEE